jgi:hypothetical protein
MNDNIFEDIEKFLRETKNDAAAILSEEQIQFLILMLATHREDKGFTEEEAVNLIRWAERQLVGKSVLDLVLKGLVWIDDKEGKFKDDDVLVGLTSLGEAARASS